MEFCRCRFEEYKIFVYFYGIMVFIFVILNLVFVVVVIFVNILVIGVLWRVLFILSILKKFYLSFVVFDFGVGVFV